MKNILITGSSGMLGGKLTHLICDSTEYGVVAVGSGHEKIMEMVDREKIINKDKIIVLSNDEFFSKDLTSMLIKGVVHFAFSRAVFSNKDIASSLDYSMAAFNKIIESRISDAIYISSQSIYGDEKDFRKESTPPAPNGVYAMAKYAGEKIFETCYCGHDDLRHSILRLDLVIQSQNLVGALCRNAIEIGQLNLKGGKQVFSYIDMTEVPYAILALLERKSDWKPVYNVGQDRVRYTLFEIAECVKNVAEENGTKVKINLEEDNTELWAGMETRLFMDDTGWKPHMSLRDMVRSIYSDYQK